MPSHKALYKTWHDDISKLELNHRRTCHLFSKQQLLQQVTTQQQQDDKCGCGRLKRSHSYDGTPKSESDVKWSFIFHSKRIPDMKNCGILYNPYASCLTKIIRCDLQAPIENLYNLIQEDCNQKPRLIISISGGAKYFKMNKRLQKEFMRGIIEAATTADGWILTTGLNSGVAKLVGEAILQDRLLKDRSKAVISIGLTKWGSLDKTTRDRLLRKFTLQNDRIHEGAKEEDYEFPEEILDTTDPETIELHHTYMLLFDDGQLSGYIGDEHRRRFVEKASNNQNKCYAVTVIVEGGKNTLDVILDDLKEKCPVVIIGGSGRMANVLSDLLTKYPGCVPKSVEISDRLEKEFQNDEINSDGSVQPNDYKSCEHRIAMIMAEENRYLLNVYSLDNDINVAETIFNAIFKRYKKMVPEHQGTCTDSPGNQHHSQIDIKTLLDLSVLWNSLKGVKQVLKGINDIKEGPKQFSSTIAEQFCTSIKDDKAMLVDYFLRSEYNVWSLLKWEDILSLYKEVWNKAHLKQYLPFTRGGEDRQVREMLGVIDLLCEQLIGSFIRPFYSKKSLATNAAGGQRLIRPTAIKRYLMWYSILDTTEITLQTIQFHSVFNNPSMVLDDIKNICHIKNDSSY